jgi:hypothetical protein
MFSPDFPFRDRHNRIFNQMLERIRRAMQRHCSQCDSFQEEHNIATITSFLQIKHFLSQFWRNALFFQAMKLSWLSALYILFV